MALVKIIEYAEASPEVKVVYDDIMKTRGVDWINNFWKVLANDPAQLARVSRLWLLVDRRVEDAVQQGVADRDGVRLAPRVDGGEPAAALALQERGVRWGNEPHPRPLSIAMGRGEHW